NGERAMNAKSFDAKYFREKAAICQRLADGLSLNNPGRFQLMDIAEDLQELAKELEVQVAQQAEFAPAIRTRAASSAMAVVELEEGTLSIDAPVISPPGAVIIRASRQLDVPAPPISESRLQQHRIRLEVLVD